MESYDHKKIEPKWQEYWEKHPDIYSADEKSKKGKMYVLDMFPYPSGDGLHAGHVESYTATDIVSRYFRLKQYNVLHPQGWDAFGLPAENYAIKTKIHPSITTQKAISNFKHQMGILGLSYDWSREVNSSDPNYYKWTQWFFLLLYKNGLAYKSKAKVNWCDQCQTVLANEQAEGGICERCKKDVVQKDLEQWFFKITDFVENKNKTAGLISGLDKIDWPSSTKLAQKNWIGKSEGAQFKMPIVGTDKNLEVFTTRLDTVFGMTFALIAPEHELVQQLKPQITNWNEVKKYIVETKSKSELQRISEVKEKTGVQLKGIRIINPFTKEEIPLFVSDFVLAHYGTGAVMAVPAHDERDYDFAKKYNLNIKKVILPEALLRILRNPEDTAMGAVSNIRIESECFTLDGELTNSGEYNGLSSADARKAITQWLEEKGIGKGTINYKLRDWLVSRQRYWGAPIPIIYCEKCGEVPVPEKDLPVLLPDDVDFMPHGESPLVRSKKFHDVKCPKCGLSAKRESDTMDTFVCSSWYYFRYADPKNNKEFASKEEIKKWLPVDLYVGGAEHNVLHLLYSRFFTKVLHNLGYIEFDEPFFKLRHQGIILAEDGRKMSKSLGNVVNPDDVINEYGADALRMFEMFMGPLEDSKPWNTKGIVGISRFLERIWNLKEKISDNANPQIKKSIHKAIKKISGDIEGLDFNTAISAMMILTNELGKESFSKEDFEIFLILLSPFAPHIAEELWQSLGHKDSIFKEQWPEFDPKLVKDDVISLVIQVNGKVRDNVEAEADISEEKAKELALSRDNVKRWIEGKEIKKVIFVPNKLLNIVI